jgi:5-methylthioadenosine/S-adenosylhomocysteine deaminase
MAMAMTAPAVTLRLGADVVLPLDDSGRVHRPGVVDLVGGRIAWVGPRADAPPSATPERWVGGLLMPGLVNTHGHTPMTLLRGSGDGLPLDRWLRESIWPREAQLTDEDVYWGMLLGVDELLRSGVTTTCEMYLHNRALAAAVRDAGIRCVITPGIFDLPGGGPESSWESFLDAAGALHADLHDRDGLVQVGLGPHSPYALPPEGLRATAKVAAELGALVQVHVAETAEEGRRIAAAFGCSGPELLARLGVFDGPVLAAHSVWLRPGDFDLYQEYDVAVAHCPQSNGKLGSGVARVTEMLNRGIRVGLGTDGPASNDNLDLWEELRLAPLLARGVTADAGAMSARQALRLATAGGAEALGLDTGRLEAGRPADLIRLELADSKFTPALTTDDLVAHLVWSASSRHVTDVWVAGRQVVAAGCCTTVDAAEARGEVVRRAHRIFEAALRAG